MDEIDDDLLFNLNEDKFKTFDDLIKSLIWQFLYTMDIINLSMTSKGFERICVDINSKLLLEERLFTVREYGEFIYNHKKPISRIKSIERMIILFPNITNLSFNCEDKINRGRMFSLDHLDNGVYCEFPDSMILKQIPTTLLELSLPIKSDFELNGIKRFYNLQKLEIVFALISDDILYHQVGFLRHLFSLKLCYCISLTKEFLFMLVNNDSSLSTTLTELDLHGCYKIGGFGRCFEYLSKLTYLNVEGTKINNDDLRFIFLNLENLVNLNLNDCHDLDLDRFEWNSYNISIFSNLSQLKTLSLRGQDKLQKIGLITRLVNLTSLDLSECKSIFMTTPNHQYLWPSAYGLDNLKYLSNLEILILDGCDIDSRIMCENFPYLSKLTVLDLTHFNFLSGMIDMGFNSNYKFISLTSLKLRYCEVMYSTLPIVDVKLSFLVNMRNLTFLDISRIGEDMKESEVLYLGYLTKLKILRLDQSFETISHLGFQLICSNLTNLTSLSIQSIAISANGITQHLSKLSCLRTLSLRSCTLYDCHGKAIDNNVIDFSLFPTSLISLDVDYLKPSCESMIDSIFALQGLKELKICQWKNIDDGIMSRLSLSLTKLEKLCLLGCGKNVTNIGLSKLSLLINLKYLLIDNNQFKDSFILRLHELSERNLDIIVV